VALTHKIQLAILMSFVWQNQVSTMRAAVLLHFYFCYLLYDISFNFYKRVVVFCVFEKLIASYNMTCQHFVMIRTPLLVRSASILKTILQHTPGRIKI
jgi:hypothetical protein